MRLRIGPYSVRVHALLPILWLLAAHMGLGAQAAAFLPALAVHEAAHLLAAKCCSIPVEGLELTPLGASIRLRGPWNAHPLRIVCMALAGPGASLLFLCLTAACAYAGALSPEKALLLIRPNVLLALVNLVPALPLDGGRALCALLSVRSGVTKAVRIGVMLGYAFSALLAGAAVFAGARDGVWNIAPIAAAVYICACASREIGCAAGADAQSLVLRGEELRRRGRLPVRLLAVSQEETVAGAMAAVRPGSVHLFVLYDGAMRPAGMLGEAQLLERFPAEASAPLRSLIPEEKIAPGHAFAP